MIAVTEIMKLSSPTMRFLCISGKNFELGAMSSFLVFIPFVVITRLNGSDLIEGSNGFDYDLPNELYTILTTNI